MGRLPHILFHLALLQPLPTSQAVGPLSYHSVTPLYLQSPTSPAQGDLATGAVPGPAEGKASWIKKNE